jgi:hypothetical protein
MIKAQVDPETNDVLPPFGVENDTDGKYKKFKTPDTELNAMYLIKANAPINTEAYSYVKTQMYSGKVKFLIEETSARAKLMSTKVGQNMSIDQRNEYLKPFVLTTALKAQTLNLVEETQGINIILKQSSRSVLKDKFSAFLYAMYYIKQEEERKKRKKSFSMSDFLFFS